MPSPPSLVPCNVVLPVHLSTCFPTPETIWTTSSPLAGAFVKTVKVANEKRQNTAARRLWICIALLLQDFGVCRHGATHRPPPLCDCYDASHSEVTRKTCKARKPCKACSALLIVPYPAIGWWLGRKLIEMHCKRGDGSGETCFRSCHSRCLRLERPALLFRGDPWTEPTRDFTASCLRASRRPCRRS